MYYDFILKTEVNMVNSTLLWQLTCKRGCLIWVQLLHLKIKRHTVDPRKLKFSKFQLFLLSFSLYLMFHSHVKWLWYIKVFQKKRHPTLSCVMKSQHSKVIAGSVIGSDPLSCCNVKDWNWESYACRASVIISHRTFRSPKFIVCYWAKAGCSQAILLTLQSGTTLEGNRRWHVVTWIKSISAVWRQTP